jgi:hypothetical protein
MHQTTLLFKIKDPTTAEKQRLLEIFFKAWVDSTCNDEVSYKMQVESTPSPHHFEEIVRVEFDRIEDAVALKLKGVPSEFKNYIEIVT